MAVNLPKIADTPYLSLYCNSTKQNDNVTMTFPVNSSLQCFRTAALSMVTLNMESRSPMGRVNAENHSKTWKSSGVNGLSKCLIVRAKELFKYPMVEKKWLFLIEGKQRIKEMLFLSFFLVPTCCSKKYSYTCTSPMKGFWFHAFVARFPQISPNRHKETKSHPHNLPFSKGGQGFDNSHYHTKMEYNNQSFY